jgi:hypothetical protein
LYQESDCRFEVYPFVCVILTDQGHRR